MDKKQKIKIAIGVITIIMIIFIIIKISKEKEQINNEQEKTNNSIIDTGKEENKEYVKKEGIYKENNANNYYTVLDIIVKYNMEINKKEQEKVYNMLNKEYIKNQEITKNNVIEKVKIIESDNIYYKIQDLYTKKLKELDEYYIYGTISKDIFSDTFKDAYYKVRADNTKKIFDIKPINKQEYEKYIKGENKEETEKIEENEHNKFIVTDISEQTIISNMLVDYKNKIKKDTKKAYELLNSKYREAKFRSYEEFKEYSNNTPIKKALLNEYSKTEKDGKITYIVVDQNKKIYIIETDAIMEYNIMLDVYTSPNEQTIKNYIKLKDTEKAIYNIKTCFEAMENKDYKYIFNKMDETFKNKNFKTVEKFQEYVDKNFYEDMEMKVLEAEKKGEYIIVTVQINNEQNKKEKKVKKFIVSLLEKTSFVMSFNIE